MPWSGVVLFILTAGMTGSLQGQDPSWSHFYANTLYLNPSMAGTEGDSRVFAGYRNQWPSTGSAYVTYHTSYDRYVEELHGGLGMKVMNDRQGGGRFNQLAVDVVYAYRFRATHELEVSWGLQAGIGQRAFQTGGLVFGDMIDPVTGNTLPLTEYPDPYQSIFPDFAAGFSAFWRNIFGGLAVHHLLEPGVSPVDDPSSELPRKYTLHAGMILPVVDPGTGREILQVSPHLVFIQQQRIQQVNYGIELYFKQFIAGLWGRHDLLFNYGNLVFSAGYGNDQFRFRYSYDVKLTSPKIQLPSLGEIGRAHV